MLPACRPPSEVTAGDTLHWSRQISDYLPSDGWALNYTLVGAAAVYNVTASGDGEAFAVNVDAATSKAWQAGTYRVQEYVTKGDSRFTLGTFLLTVAPDLTAATAGIDTRTHARKVLDSINTWLESKAPVAGNLEINGRKISYYPLPDLIKLQSRYQMLVTREEAKGRGGVVGTRILTVL